MHHYMYVKGTNGVSGKMQVDVHLFISKVTIELLETEETLIQVFVVHPRVKGHGVFLTE